MSTILDALRKLEEERHSRTADARSRLLLAPTTQPRLLRPQRSFWQAKSNLFWVIGFLCAGFSAGAGFFFWRSYSNQTSHDAVLAASSPMKEHAANEKLASSSQMPAGKPDAGETEPTEESVKAQPQETIEPGQETFPPTAPLADTPQVLTAGPAETGLDAFSPQSSSSALSVPETAPSLPSSPLEAQETVLASASVIQRSPFVAAPPVPPAPRETSPPRKESTQIAKHTPAPTASPLNNTARNGSRYEVLLPNGETRTVQPPSSLPSPATGTTLPTSSGTSLSLLQWSSDPERRIAFLRVNGGPLTMTHEGDTIGGYTVVEIRQDAVELQSGETRMTLRPQ